jgi:hypothetical protein
MKGKCSDAQPFATSMDFFGLDPPLPSTRIVALPDFACRCWSEKRWDHVDALLPGSWKLPFCKYAHNEFEVG